MARSFSTSRWITESCPFRLRKRAGASPSANDVSADGKKFLMLSEGNETSAEPLTLVVNWPSY
jgi:hypothetical protein